MLTGRRFYHLNHLNPSTSEKKTHTWGLTDQQFPQVISINIASKTILTCLTREVSIWSPTLKFREKKMLMIYSFFRVFLEKHVKSSIHTRDKFDSGNGS